ncbi:hypothetical protein [Xanthomonas graminis]|uniref:hypothetical protein n=1 Tax=Xanthomonas graminis TaxID=3390026 RepID=UPI000AD883F6|nr:hypothetical protein [Xanthomonas translucens]UKE56527.1 hypothetical protein KFS84_06150 [Xanthomonas translucens pv. graminis]WIH18162.1 hypothetical protein KM433_14945 [Xanthomonas translucens pv. graminis]
MSEYRADDLEMAGYFLPEESQFRLVRLGEFIKFLVSTPRKIDPSITRGLWAH